MVTLNKICMLVVYYLCTLLLMVNSSQAGDDLDRSLGSKEAKVELVKYSSLTCPYCADFYKNMFQHLKKEYIDTGKVRFIHRNFALNKIDLEVSQIAYCIPGKDNFYKFIRVLFTVQSKWRNRSKYLERVISIAKIADLWNDKVNECRKGKAIQKQIVMANQNAKKTYNIKSTPTFLVNGELHKFNNYKQMSRVLDSVLDE